MGDIQSTTALLSGGVALFTLCLDSIGHVFVFHVFGIAGVAVVLLGALLAGFAYSGKKGEAYSPLNHFISELGEVGVSKLAWVFNGALILSGMCLVLASISLGLLLNTFLSKIALGLGIVSAVSLALVGVFPMNKIKPHGMAAITYFRAGLAMVILFSMAIAFQPWLQPTLGRGFALAGLPPILAFSAFLVLIHRASRNTDEPLATGDIERPRIWTIAVVEWSVFIATVLWYVVIALGL